MANNKKQKTGQIGENIACEYLEDNSFWILERNYRKPWGEIDIIAKSPKGTLVFVEVKTMKNYSNGLKPEDQLTKDKLERFKRAASIYAGNNQDLIDDKVGWRLDLIAIVINDNNNDKKAELNHYEQIL